MSNRNPQDILERFASRNSVQQSSTHPNWFNGVMVTIIVLATVFLLYLLFQFISNPMYLDRPSIPAPENIPVVDSALSPEPQIESTPTTTIPSDAIVINAMDGAGWTPDDRSVSIPREPALLTGEQIGDRCRIELLISGAHVWVPCMAVGVVVPTNTPQPTFAPAPTRAPVCGEPGTIVGEARDGGLIVKSCISQQDAETTLRNLLQQTQVAADMAMTQTAESHPVEPTGLPQGR